tara:strand:- start:12598 stop:13128 length:531 start_codon:yes stop_codon:yes gene_type:complete
MGAKCVKFRNGNNDDQKDNQSNYIDDNEINNFPSAVKDYSSNELRDIIKEKLNLSGSKVKNADSKYSAYSHADLKKFLHDDVTNALQYKPENFDCDDFAVVTMGNEKKWHWNSKVNRGSTFGIVWGDIRTDDEPNESRPHAVNMYVDPEGELWLIEPQNDNWFKPNEYSTFWFAFC